MVGISVSVYEMVGISVSVYELVVARGMDDIF